MSERFKVFGLQRSGTNAVHKLLCDNFKVVSLDHSYGWKHGSAEAFINAEQGAVLVHCVRDPLAWLESCFRFFKRTVGIAGTDKRFRRAWCFHEFLRRPHYEFANPIDRWNRMNRHWMTAYAGPVLTVRDELIYGSDSQTQFIAWVKQQLGWQRHEKLSLCDLRVTPAGTLLNERMDSGYFVKRQYLARYSPEDLLHCHCHIDWELAHLMGFTKEGQPHATH